MYTEGITEQEHIAADRIVSTNDIEMRHGRKSSSKRFDGYKVHVIENFDTEWITEVEVAMQTFRFIPSLYRRSILRPVAPAGALIGGG